MSNVVSQEHENVFQRLLQTVDNAGARATLAHVWDVLKEVAGAVAPVVEPIIETAIPEAAPVVAAVERAGTFAGKDVEELAAYIEKLQGQLEKMKANMAPEATPAPAPEATS